MWNKFFLILLIINFLYPKNLKREIDLKGKWKFKIGDDIEYANIDYNDFDWERINVPEPWENSGFPGYDGFAWYRVHFYLKDQLKDKYLIIKLGRIDDVDRAAGIGHRDRW